MTEKEFYGRYRKMLRKLTPQEKVIAKLMWLGLSDKAIADFEGVNISTVRFHLTNAMQKIGAVNRVQLAIVIERSHGRDSLAKMSATFRSAFVGTFWDKYE